MQTIYADYAFIIEGAVGQVTFKDISDFLRIMTEDDYKLTYKTSNLSVYTPNKSNLKGESSFIYILRNDTLLNSAIFAL